MFKTTDLTKLDEKVADFVSKSGSEYFYTEEGVYRFSTHWGRAATCRWRLQQDEVAFKNKKQLGYAKWTDFYRDNEVERLYFITQNEYTKRFEYFHKEGINFDEKYVLRTAQETRKILRQIKTLQTETKWAKYIQHSDIEHLRDYLINGLITSSKGLPELKRAYDNY